MSQASGGVIIMAGGTGGHIFPGLAVAGVLLERGIAVRWLGASGAMECRRVPAAGIALDVVDITGLRGKGLRRWLQMPWRLARAVWQALAVFKARRPACAISFGGYAAAPGGLAARLRGVPLLVHEQNRVPGLTNRFLAHFASKVLEGFPGSWPARRRAITCGNPVRAALLAVAPPAVRLAGRNGPPRLLITGGSQGAGALNRVLPAALARLPQALRPEVRHQAGKGHLAATRAAYAEAGLSAQVDEFIDDMAAAYAWADLVVCRSGALTVAELAVVGIGALLVPFPHAVDDHQTRNAEFLAAAGAARLLPEPQCTPARLATELAALLGGRAALLQMAQAARALAVPDAAERVAALCLDYLP